MSNEASIEAGQACGCTGYSHEHDCPLRDFVYPIGTPAPWPCPDCGAAMTLKRSRFGSGIFYGCERYPDCRGAMSAHPDGRPFGTPADAETRSARACARRVFGRLFEGVGAPMSRDEAEAWRLRIMKLSERFPHIGTYRAGHCKNLIRYVNIELCKRQPKNIVSLSVFSNLNTEEEDDL